MSSLQSFARGLRPDGNSPRVDASLLDIYLILYDMLNDDDEELRDMAALTTSWVLSYSSVSPNASIAYGPLNASALLASFIAKHYSDSDQLAHRVARYLTGQERRISGSDDQTALVPVSHLVHQYSQESTILFVEEKQNLFIDEVREVDVWSQVLLHLKKNALPENVVRQIAGWTAGGLQYISGYITQDSGEDGYLGWMSKPDSYTLIVRIISIVLTLVSDGFAAPELMGIEQSVLREQLQTFLKLGQIKAVHDELLSRIEYGLSSGVPKGSQI